MALTKVTQSMIKGAPVGVFDYLGSTVSGNTTVPSSVTLQGQVGFVVTVQTGVTLTIDGFFFGEPQQFFDCEGTGKVVFTNVNEIYPEWFGGYGDGTNKRIEIQKAIDSMPNNSALVFTSGEYGYDTTSITLSHTTSGGTANYVYDPAVFLIQNKTNITVLCRGGRFKEIFDPSTKSSYYPLLLCQNITYSNFSIEFDGYVTLQDGVYPSGTLDTKGAEVLLFVDNCFYNNVVAKARSARVPFNVRIYAPGGALFTDATRPSNTIADIQAVDCKYGVRYEGNYHTQTRVLAQNCKRSYRIDGGVDHIGDVSAFNKDVDSWSSGQGWDVYLQSSLVELRFVNLRVNIWDRGNVPGVCIIGRSANSVIDGVNVEMNYRSDGTGLYILNGYGDGVTPVDANVLMKNITVSGSITTTGTLPIRIWPRFFSIDNTSQIDQLALTNLYVLATVSPVQDFIRIENGSAAWSTPLIYNMTISNVKLNGGSDNTAQSAPNSAFKKGALCINNVHNPQISDLSHMCTGITGESTLNFVLCEGLSLTNVVTPGNITRPSGTAAISGYTTYGSKTGADYP